MPQRVDVGPSPPVETEWTVASELGVVAGGAEASVRAGAAALGDGGNAADAAVATIFALNVTDHGYCSIGGEVPLLIFDKETKSIRALSGQGRAPRSERAIEWYLANGIPGTNDIKMAPVPSVVDLCITTLQIYGTMSLERVISPTLALLAGADEPWSANLAGTLEKLVAEERRTVGNRQQKLQAATDRFYGRNEGVNDVADQLVDDYEQLNGFLRREDLAHHTTTIEDPVSTSYRGFDVYKCGPWTQGPVVLQALRLLEGFDLRSMGYLSGDYIHVLVEAMKLAMADRDAYYGDPEFVEVPLDALLSDEYSSIRRHLIDMSAASNEARPGDVRSMKPIMAGGVFRPGLPGTTTCVVADRHGNVVSATPSANVDVGSHGGRTGVTYGNRLRSFNITQGHPNCIEPGKRPRITLTPTIVLEDGVPCLAISVAGGDMQDQVTLGLLLDFVEFNMTPERAVTAPRFISSFHQDSFDPAADRQQTYKDPGTLRINASVEESVRRQLSARGHVVETSDRALAAPVMLHVDQQTGLLSAAGDFAAGRHVAGLR